MDKGGGTMSTYSTIQVKYMVADPLTPIHMELKEDQAWLTIEEAKDLQKRLKQAIKHAKTMRR